MGKTVRSNRGFSAAPGVIAILGLLAACAPVVRGPAPVVYGGAYSGAHGPTAPGALPSSPLPASVVVQPGQSLSIIAHTYHLAWPALAAANHLSPPYRVKPGQRLIIPASGAYAAAPPPLAVASLPPPERPQPVALVPPERPRPVETRPLPRVIPLDASGSRRATPAQPLGQSFDRPIPLDNPAAVSAARSHPPAMREAATEEHGSDFIWPVRGPIVEGFGAGPDGTRNQGINIAAPRDAPVRAADGGVVVYVGNELRGYGNLILIRHPQGWISAYAHCGAVLVKRGQRVRRGQIIARVGATGDVRQPQLHFELRRGKKAIDPRPLLGVPAKAADAGRSRAS
jgi:murein DD-endopeptidase MepM/ murein hydrolase activator NlpD